jgi:hypothetical protein
MRRSIVRVPELDYPIVMAVLRGGHPGIASISDSHWMAGSGPAMTAERKFAYVFEGLALRSSGMTAAMIRCPVAIGRRSRFRIIHGQSGAFLYANAHPPFMCSPRGHRSPHRLIAEASARVVAEPLFFCPEASWRPLLWRTQKMLAIGSYRGRCRSERRGFRAAGARGKAIP